MPDAALNANCHSLIHSIYHSPSRTLSSTTTMVDAKMATETTAKKPEKKKARGQASASEESASPYPDMEFAQQIHKLTVKSVGVDAEFQQKVFKTIAEELENPSLYRLLQTNLQVQAGILSEADLTAMQDKHAKHVEELEAKVEDAKESAGDMEVMDARVEIARFAAKSLTKEEALEAYKKLLDLPKISSGKKIDSLMESSRVASFYGDTDKSFEFIDSVRKKDPSFCVYGMEQTVYHLTCAVLTLSLSLYIYICIP
jgi:hypothetical protein